MILGIPNTSICLFLIVATAPTKFDSVAKTLGKSNNYVLALGDIALLIYDYHW